MSDEPLNDHGTEDEDQPEAVTLVVDDGILGANDDN